MFFLMIAMIAEGATPPTSLRLLTGIGASLDADPTTLKLGVQYEIGVPHDSSTGISLVVPVEMTTSGSNGAAFSASNSMFTLIPSLRVKLFTANTVRFYLDDGVGLAQITADRDGWLHEEKSERTGLATRFAAGFEIGPPAGGILVAIEPLGIDTLHFPGRESVAYVARIGIGGHYSRPRSN